MAKPPSIRLLIECLLVAVLGFGVWQLYFKSDKKRIEAEEAEPGRALNSSSLIKHKAKPDPFVSSNSSVPSPMRAPREENVLPEPVLPESGQQENVQEGVLEGIIVDQEGRRRIGSISVSDDGQNIYLETLNGEFQETLAAGQYTVTARDMDNEVVSAPVVVEVEAGQSQSIQLVLPVLPTGDIGLDFQKRQDWIEVTVVWSGGPAQQAGIQPGDLIIEIAGTPVRELGRRAINELLAGPVGTPLELIMAVAEDDGWVDVPVTLTRDELSR